MKKIIFLIIAVFMLLSIAVGCAKDTASIVNIKYPESIAADDYEAQQEVKQQNQVDEGTIEAIRDFTANSASVVLKGKGENSCYSPLSLYMALSVLSTGAGGETEDELLSLLNVDDTQYLSEQMGKLFRLMYTDNDMSKLIITNSLWINKEYEIKQDFTQNAMNNFYAAANNLDFSDPNAGQEITNWISENTNGLLAPEFKVDPMKLMFIINTIYLNDEWQHNFDEDATKEDVFYTDDGNTVNAQFMTDKFETDIIKGDGYTAANLYLKNTGKMTFILPNEGTDVNSLISNSEAVEALINSDNAEHGSVIMTLPKFSFDTEMDLKENLESLGLVKAFDPNDANLSGIIDLDAYVSSVKQGSNISIDENGVEAATYTSIEISLTVAPLETEPIELNFNRPFIFVIQGNEDIPIFIGVIQDPTK